MIAVRELLGLEPVAGFYQPLGGGDLRARGVFVEGGRRATAWSATTAASRRSSRSCSRTRAAGRWRWRRGCAPARSSPARPRARATGAATPGSAVLDLSEPETDSARVHRRAARGDRAPQGRPAARRRRRQRQDLRAGRAVRALGARGRDRGGGDPHDHVHREGGRGDARAHPRAAAGARAPRATAHGPPRARSSRPSTASAPGCCALTRWPPAWIPRSWCSTRPTPSGWPTPRSRTRSRRSGAPARAPIHAAIDLIAAYTAAGLRGAILQVHDELRSRGERRPRLPALPEAPDLGRPGAISSKRPRRRAGTRRDRRSGRQGDRGAGAARALPGGGLGG